MGEEQHNSVDVWMDAFDFTSVYCCNLSEPVLNTLCRKKKEQHNGKIDRREVLNYPEHFWLEENVIKQSNWWTTSMARMHFSDRFRAPQTIHASSIVNLPPTTGVTGVELVCRFAGIDFNYHCRQRIIAGHLCTEPILKHFNWTHLPDNLCIIKKSRVRHDYHLFNIEVL